MGIIEMLLEQLFAMMYAIKKVSVMSQNGFNKQNQMVIQLLILYWWATRMIKRMSKYFAKIRRKVTF